MYINLMIQIKHYVNVKKAKKSFADARKKLLNFYNELFNAEMFEQMTIYCFKERFAAKMKTKITIEIIKKKKLILNVIFLFSADNIFLEI